MSSSAPSDGLTAQQYLSQERFRRVCPVNGASYCDIGPSAPSDVLVMLCGSAMDSVLTSAIFDDFCTSKGVRLICVDKPGMGQTPACPLADRVATHTSAYPNIDDVLTHLDVRPKALISISSGFIYALHFLAHKGTLFEGRPPALFALTPWISFDDAPSLGYTSFAPNWLVSAVPAVMGTFTSPRLMAAFAWSTGVSTAVSTAVKSVGPAGAPTLNSEGPAQLIRTASQDRLHLAVHDSVRSPGMADEYLLCLGRGPAGFWGYKDYNDILGRIAQAAVSGLTQRPRLRLFMGDNDGMVPRKAQERFVALFSETSASSLPDSVKAMWDFDHITFPGGGHNDVPTYERCWETIATYARSTTG